jgi:hypothetical protein
MDSPTYDDSAKRNEKKLFEPNQINSAKKALLRINLHERQFHQLPN